MITDNVEAYAPGNPIFALSGDDNLTGSSGHDMFVFSQPIGHDVIHSFDAASDQIDLIGYADFTGFGDILGAYGKRRCRQCCDYARRWSVDHAERGRRRVAYRKRLCL